MSGSAWIKVMNRSSDFVSDINVVSGQVMNEPVDIIPNAPHAGLAFVE
jgi:hypothetical protein